MNSPVSTTRDSTNNAEHPNPLAPRAAETQVPPLAASREQPLSEKEEAQVQNIINATEARDWHELARLAAAPGGFIDDEVRRIVCMYELCSLSLIYHLSQC